MTTRPTAAAVAAKAVERLHGPAILYTQEDCQQFIKNTIRMCGGELKGSGTNDIYRNQCQETWPYGPGDEIEPGDMLFICEDTGKEPARFLGDGIGDVNHIGIYCGAPGAEVIHSSKSRGGVFPSTIRNAWNRRGRLACLHYGEEAGEQAPGGKKTQVYPDAALSTGEGAVVGSAPRPRAESDPGQARVATQTGVLNLRRQPKARGTVIKGMPKGTIVDVLGTWGEWAQVRYVAWDGVSHEGWCAMEYLVFGGGEG